MRNALRIFVLAIGVACLVGAAAARAGALVEFPNLSDHMPAKLWGYLARPDAGLSGMLASHSDRARPYPAVVVLHGCGGISSHSAKIADRLGSWGYVALTVDSLGPRGLGRGMLFGLGDMPGVLVLNLVPGLVGRLDHGGPGPDGLLCREGGLVLGETPGVFGELFANLADFDHALVRLRQFVANLQSQRHLLGVFLGRRSPSVR